MWEDKKKSMMDQMKRGLKTPLFRNNSHRQPNSKEPKMIEEIGKIPRKPPIQCSGCGGDHVLRYFPHRGEKVKTCYNVHQVETVEDMGRSVPRIYASMDNKQDEFQAHMVEVEGKINNQTIVILIHSGSSHSYLDPKMVKIYEFPRSNIGKPYMMQLAT
jgi:hypothetical protein